jgi:hypothetical protein
MDWCVSASVGVSIGRCRGLHVMMVVVGAGEEQDTRAARVALDSEQT